MSRTSAEISLLLASPSAKITTRTVWSNGATVRNYCGQDRSDSGNRSKKRSAAEGYRKMTMILIDDTTPEGVEGGT